LPPPPSLLRKNLWKNTFVPVGVAVGVMTVTGGTVLVDTRGHARRDRQTRRATGRLWGRRVGCARTASRLSGGRKGRVSGAASVDQDAEGSEAVPTPRPAPCALQSLRRGGVGEHHGACPGRFGVFGVRVVAVRHPDVRYAASRGGARRGGQRGTWPELGVEEDLAGGLLVGLCGGGGVRVRVLRRHTQPRAR